MKTRLLKCDFVTTYKIARVEKAFRLCCYGGYCLINILKFQNDKELGDKISALTFKP